MPADVDVMDAMDVMDVMNVKDDKCVLLLDAPVPDDTHMRHPRVLERCDVSE